jgi:hypothetical protein
MNILKLSGLAAVAGLLLIAAPENRAQAAPMASQGLAAAVQRDVIPDVTEAHYRRHWHRHAQRRHHPHWRRHHWQRRHWHHRRHWR